MKSNLLQTLILALIFIGSACQDDQNNTETPVDEKGPVNLYKDKAKFDEAAQLRSSTYSALFSIDRIERNAGILDVEVSYAQGCEGTFDVIWSGEIMESYPMQSRLFLKFDATGCQTGTQEKVKKVIRIDLIELIGDESLVRETIFHISNASSLQDVKCESDCDKNVSNG